MSDDLVESSGSSESSESSGSITASDFEAASAIASPEETSAETTSAEEPDADDRQALDAPAPVVPVVPERPKGPIPFEAHSRALDNARTKAREEVTQEFDRRYGWAKQVHPEQLQAWNQTATRMVSDPVGFVDDFMQQLEADPRYQAEMRSRVERRLAVRRQQAEANQPPQPDVEIVDAHGQVVGLTYSSQQLQRRDALLKQQMMHELQQDFAQRMGPLDQMRQQVEADAEHQRLSTKVDGMLENAVKNYPHFAEHQRAIGLEVRNGRSLQDAYLVVLQRDIMPGLQSAERTSVMNHMQQKTKASTVSPQRGVASVATPDSDKPWEQLFRERAHFLS